MALRGWLLVAILLGVIPAQAAQAKLPLPKLKHAPELNMPGSPRDEARQAAGELDGEPTPFVDSNSPASWVGSTLVLLHSAGAPAISTGPSAEELDTTARTVFPTTSDFNPQIIDTDFRINRTTRVRGGHWIESTWQDDDGTLYGWYHYEPRRVCGKESALTAPMIGAAISADNGSTWADLGLVLTAPTNSLDCSTANYYFAGGNGDFTVLRRKKYFYFLFSAYAGPVDQQGLAVARMQAGERNHPVGQVFKWHDGRFDQPGIGGTATPIVEAKQSWHSAAPDAFWGPSVHKNSYLHRYVMLLNRAGDSLWTQRGIYISFNRDLSDPEGWSDPRKLIEGGDWYPQVIGTDLPGEGTDKKTGKKPRFFMHGTSDYKLKFRRHK